MGRLLFFWSHTLCWLTTLVSGASWQVIFSLWPWFLPCFYCRFYGNLYILLTFSAVSTFVFKSNGNILEKAMRNRFLSLSPLINSSNSSWTKSESVVKSLVRRLSCCCLHFLQPKMSLPPCCSLQKAGPVLPSLTSKAAQMEISFRLILLKYWQTF